MPKHTSKLSNNVALQHLFLEAAPQASPVDLSELARTAIAKAVRLVGGEMTNLRMHAQTIEVSWSSHAEIEGPFLGLLEDGRSHEAGIAMELVLAIDARNTTCLYNLGMVYSDAGFLDRAVDLLARLVDIEPDHVNGLVALGVAYVRSGDLSKGETTLRQAIEIDDDNPWAARNLGGVYLKQGKYEEAIGILTRATELDPTDERTWFGLAQAHEATGRAGSAAEAYRKVIAVNEFGNLADTARSALTKMATDSFRSPSAPRMDAVMYLLAALEKFEEKDDQEMQAIGFEIAMLGTKGIKINDADSRYAIATLPGEFTGLSLICHQYVAFKRFAPTMDIGIDLSAEYDAAKKLHEMRKDNG